LVTCNRWLAEERRVLQRFACRLPWRRRTADWKLGRWRWNSTIEGGMVPARVSRLPVAPRRV